MGHPRIPEHQIEVFWQATQDGFTVRQAAQIAGLTYYQGRYVKEMLRAQGKQGNSYQFRYALPRQHALELLAQGVSCYTAAKLVGVAPKTVDAWHRAATAASFPADNAPTHSDPAPTAPTPTAAPDRRPVDRREGLWSRPPRVSVPPADRRRDDPWAVDGADD